MGVSVGPTSSGGRKTVDAELNLIPFIDLLSCCILFLLMTAVWVQISKMNAFTQPGGQALIENSSVTNLNAERENRDWDVIVKTSGVEVIEAGKLLATFKPDVAEQEIARLRTRLTKLDAKVSLRAADDVVYQDLITVLDALFTAQLTNVTVGGLN